MFYFFNIFEAIIWLMIGLMAFWFRNTRQKRYKALAIYIFIVFILFAISDILEMVMGSFYEPRMYWLLVWKEINIAAILGAIGWYLCLRIYDSPKK